jgi:hypothetical protein
MLEVCRQISENVRALRFDRESIILGEDTAASMMRYISSVSVSRSEVAIALTVRSSQRPPRATFCEAARGVELVCRPALAWSKPWLSSERSKIRLKN